MDASCYGQLSVKKKEKLTMLDDSKYWWKVKNNKNEIGIVPSGCFQRTDGCKSNPPSLEEKDDPLYESITDYPAKLTPCKVDSDVICKVKTLCRFIAQDGDELQFEAGEILDIIDQPEDNPDWFTARNGNGNVGLVPKNRVKILKPASCNQTSHSQTADNPKEYGEINERHLDEISKLLPRDWKPLGRKLPVEEAIIEAIDMNNQDVGEKAYQLLLTWKRANGRDASAEVLTNALVSTGRKDVAERLMAGYARPYEEPNIAAARSCVGNTGHEEPNIAATNCVGNTEPSFAEECSYVLLEIPKLDAQNPEGYATPYEANIAGGRKHMENAEPSYAEECSYVLLEIPKLDAQNPEGYASPYEEPNIAATRSCVGNTGGASAQITSECVKHSIKMSEVGWAKTQLLCCLLNTGLKGDFGKLGKELGYSEGEIQEFEESINPTRSLLTKRNDLFAVEVLRALEQIQMNDAVDVLRKELGTIAKKRECKCESCS